jgi:hypothetical protein
MHQPRHCIVVWVPEDDILCLLGGWTRYLVDGTGSIALPSLKDSAWEHDGTHLPIPEDVSLVGVAHAWDRKAFGFLLEHPSFAPVEAGHSFPTAILTEICIHGVPVRGRRVCSAGREN